MLLEPMHVLESQAHQPRIRWTEACGSNRTAWTPDALCYDLPDPALCEFEPIILRILEIHGEGEAFPQL